MTILDYELTIINKKKKSNKRKVIKKKLRKNK